MKKTLIFTAAFAALFILITGSLSAQTKDDAGKAFNTALALDSTDHVGALKKMLEVVGLCEKIGTDADDIKKRAMKVIPVWEYKIANDFINEKKYNEAIAAFNQTIIYSDKYSNPETKEKSLSQLPRLYFNKGQEQLKSDSADAAIKSFDKAIGYDPEYSKAYLSRGTAYKKKSDYENMQKSMDKAYELGMKTNDTITASKARDAMGSTFLSRANKSYSAKNYAQAIEFANSSLNYTSNSASAYLILCISYNAQSKFDLAIDAAKKGIDMEVKPEKQADFYLQTATAYEGKKDIANACANYRKVTTGPNKKAAEYKITTVLKCK